MLGGFVSGVEWNTKTPELKQIRLTKKLSADAGSAIIITLMSIL